MNRNDLPRKLFSDPLWFLAWVTFLAAIPTRLYFFGGFGLGDDSNFFSTAYQGYLDRALNNETMYHHRPLSMVPVILSFLAFGPTEFAFILPVLVHALLAHALSIFFAHSLLGSRGALFTSLLFLLTPFETICSTLFVPDYISAVYLLGCAMCCVHGVWKSKPTALIAAGFLFAIGLTAKTSQIAALPAFGIATLVGLRNWRLWGWFWGSLFVCSFLVCIGYYLWDGSFTRWITFSVGVDPYDITGQVLEHYKLYPRMLFGSDATDGIYTFGFASWLAAAGALLALLLFLGGRRTPALCFVLGCAVFFVAFNCLPHKFSLTHFYSYYRGYRYLAHLTPALYLMAAFLLESLYRASRPRALQMALTVAVVVAFTESALYLPTAVAPTTHALRDARVIDRFFAANPPSENELIFGGDWHCVRASWLNRPQAEAWQFRCLASFDPSEKREYLSRLAGGYVITGGPSLYWTGNGRHLLYMYEIGFKPPTEWELLYASPAEPSRWEPEPLRIWRVKGDDSIKTHLTEIACGSATGRPCFPSS